MTTAPLNTKYTIGDVTANPVGLEAIYYYNGLRLNDKIMSRSECYWLSNISGLDDADIRDSRDVNPGYDGETAYDSFYGGRTIVLEGSVVAGNFSKLRELQANMKRAFATLTEKPLRIIFNDVVDNFVDNSLPWYTFDAGSSGGLFPSPGLFPSAGLYPANGDLQIAQGQLQTIIPGVEYRLRRTGGVLFPGAGDFFAGGVGAVFNVGNALDGSKFGILPKAHDSANYLETYIVNTGGTWTLNIDHVLGGARGNHFTTTITAPAAFSYIYVRGRIVDNKIIAEVFYNQPTKPLDTAVGDFVGTYTLVPGVIFNAFRTDTTSGYTGLSFIPEDTSTFVDYWDTAVAGPSWDTFINCRKIGPIAMKEAIVNASGIITRDFQISLRASYPFFQSTFTNGGINTSTGTVSLASVSSLGRVYDKTYPYYYLNNLDSSGAILFGGNDIFPINDGNYYSLPTIRIAGPVTNPSVKNQTNGTTLSLNGTLAANEYIDIDVSKKTIIDGLGNNRFAMLGPTSSPSWLVLSPGTNKVSFFTALSGGTGYITWSNTWL